jgi:ATP-binding cassette subfamily B protein
MLGVAQAVVTFAGFVGTLFLLNPWMLAVMAAAALPALRTELTLGRQRADLMTRLTHSARREFFYSELISGVTAAKEVRLLGLGDFFGRRMLSELTTINRRSRAMDRRDMRAHMLLAALAAVVSGGGLVWAIGAAAGGRLSIGDVAVFAAAVAGGQSSLSTLLGHLGQANHSLLLFSHYRTLMSAEPDLPLAGPPQRVPALATGIVFEDVWFRYDDSHPWVLHGLDLTLAAGRSTAIVGVNGAGKSTIVKLLCRFYDPVKGRILWDGHDLRTLPPQELRDRIGAVFQDFMSYELTARENVGLGDLRALDDDRAVRQAIGEAGSTQQIAALPQGLDTMLTRTFFSREDADDPEVGVVLSGGQWQRLALARGLMRADRDLLILDEPSSGLDADAEHDIHVRLQRLREGRTSLLISHRLNTLRDADAIAVLGGGRVVEHGRHHELIARDGVYARLFLKQSQGYRADDTADDALDH